MPRPHPRLPSSLLAVVTVLVACGSTPDLAPPPDAPPDAAPPPRHANLYALHSELDLSNVPGPAGKAASALIAATDDPDDPTRYLVDQIVARMHDGALKDVAQAAEPFVTAYLNQRLLARSPQLLSRLVAIGHAFGEAAHHLGTLDTLAVAPDGTAIHAITGLRVSLDGAITELGFADRGLASPSAAVDMRVEAGRVTIAPHALTLSLGKTLRLVLDGAIVPHVDPGAVDLVGVLQSGIDCAAFGGDMADALGFGAPDAYAASCRDVVTAFATSLYAELDGVDGDTLELDLAGSAAAVDPDKDGVVDQLVDGTWTGTASYAGTPAPLAGGAFTGTRVP